MLCERSAYWRRRVTTQVKPFRANALELALVIWACLHAQASCEDELSDCSGEAREESVEWL